MEIEILAHISSQLTKENDEQHRRRLQGFLNFEPARVHSVVQDLTKSKRKENDPVNANRHESMEEVLSMTSGSRKKEIRKLTKSLSEVVEPEFKRSKDGLKRRFSDMIGISSTTLMPQTHMRLLELASTRWKRLRGVEKSPEPQVVNQKPEKVPNSTDSELDDTQLALSFLCGDISVRLSSSDGSEPMASGYNDATKVSNRNNLENATVDQVNETQVETSWIPSELSTFDPTVLKTSGAKFSSSQPSCARQEHNDLSFIPSNLSSFNLNSPKTDFENSQSSFLQPIEGDDQENIPPGSCASSSKPKASPMRLNNLPMRIDSLPTNSEYLKLEGIPGSPITRTLQRLTSSEELISKYSSVKQLRLPSTWERGYWLVDTSKWADEDDISFWTTMMYRIRKGHAGLGTWAARNVGEDGTQQEEGSVREAGLGLIRVYCWGAISKEVYLLCNLASDKMQETGAKWVSAATGEVVIFMNKNR